MALRVTPDTVPDSPEALASCLADPMWRLSNLYKIITKGEGAGDNLVVTFKPNRAQRRFLRALWHRNVILKARQLGFSTLICLLWLDHALFNANVRCGIIAQDREAAESLFRDKVKFAYDNLPADLKAVMPLARDSTTELLFAHNNSSIRVATSMRSGTIHRLHVSEFGKICAKFPEKAAEVVTGSIPAVPKSGILVIESTAEGREGEFYDITQRALAMQDAGKDLTERDYRMHFFAWWEEPGYVMDPARVVMGEKDAEYFSGIEGKIGRALTQEQRAWYVATRDADFAGQPERMWQEYPSTPDEAFQVSTEGCYYTVQLTKARKDGRICKVPHMPGYPVNTFWDIGANDETAIWCHQRIGLQHRFINYHEASGEPFEYFVRWLQAQGYVWGNHYLPHDATHKRQLDRVLESAQDMIERLGLRNTTIVNRVDDVVRNGINPTRDAMAACWWDEEACKTGLAHLEMYRKEWNARLGVWSDHPRHDHHSNGADAFRQFGQMFLLLPGAKAIGDSGKGSGRRRTNWRVA